MQFSLKLDIFCFTQLSKFIFRSNHADEVNEKWENTEEKSGKQITNENAWRWT